MSKSPADIAALLTDEPPQPVDGVIWTCLMSSPILGGSDDNRLSRLATMRVGLLALKCALRRADPWPVLVAILEALPKNDPLVRPLLVYILPEYKNVDRPMLIRAIHQAKPERKN